MEIKFSLPPKSTKWYIKNVKKEEDNETYDKSAKIKENIEKKLKLKHASKEAKFNDLLNVFKQNTYSFVESKKFLNELNEK